MHVVHLLASLETGGSELVAVELSEALLKTGHSVTVFAAKGPLSARLEQAGAQLFDWPLGHKSLLTLGYIPRFRQWVKRSRPDILHFHSRLPGWIARLALTGLGSRRRPQLVTTVHGHYSVNWYSAIMTRGNRVIAVSESICDYVRDNYPAVPDDRLVCLPLGTDPRLFPPGHKPSAQWWQSFHAEFPESRNRVFLVLPGRLTRLKGHAAFIRLLAHLVTAGYDVHGLIVGPVPRQKQRYFGELQAMIETLGISGRVSFTGSRNDLGDLFAASALVFNLSTKPEAFGRTVLEALSIGTPVVGWDYGGVREILAEVFDAGRVPPHDETALLEQCAALLKNPQKPDPERRYPLSRMTGLTLELYQTVLDEPT